MIAAMAAKGMWRMIGRQVRSRRDRSIALAGHPRGLGELLAPHRRGSDKQLEVHGTVDAASRPAYDILVRPEGRSRRDRDPGQPGAGQLPRGHIRGHLDRSVAEDPQSAQRHRGRSDREHRLRDPPGDSRRPGRPISSSIHTKSIRVNVTWKAANGLSSYPGGTDYVYYTPTDFVYIPNPYGGTTAGGGRPGSPSRAMCPFWTPTEGGLNTGAEESLVCFSGRPRRSTRTLTMACTPASVTRDVQLPDDALGDRPGPGGKARRIAADHGRREISAGDPGLWAPVEDETSGSR